MNRLTVAEWALLARRSGGRLCFVGVVGGKYIGSHLSVDSALKRAGRMYAFHRQCGMPLFAAKDNICRCFSFGFLAIVRSP